MSSDDSRQPLLAVEVWPVIHMIRTLTAPDLTYTLLRPLEEKYNALQRAGNRSIVFCFLLNRVYFIRDANITTGPISCTRADLCELLAVRLLRGNGHSILDLAIALTTSWPVWSGADPRIIQMAREERDDDLEERVGNALEMAIIGKARRFIKSSPCQKVIDEIWIGKCVYQAESSHSILSDRYKRTPIHFYDPHKAPLLDHYRLKVPAIRSVLEYVNFLILFILFVIAIETNESQFINTPELIFMIYGLGFTLEKLAAMQEHGIKVYFDGTWNGFDLAFVTTYSVYAFFRIYGANPETTEPWARDLGTDFLAVIACLLFPRLAFVTLQNNLMVLSLRAMMMQFVALMLIAAFCFCGFLYALWTLSRKGAGYSASTIAWWMLDLWFGLDASGFDRAFEFDVIFGPILMITYACLSNTLLLTVLVSILSNTFARINEDAVAEAMFRRAVSMLEGVKVDSLFSYQPPINIIALCILLPASYILSPRWFHKVNVFLIRLTNFPILLAIAWYERQRKQSNSHGFYDTVSAAAEKLYDHLPRSLKWMSFFDGLAGSTSDIEIIFEAGGHSEDGANAGQHTESPLAQATVQRRISRKSERRPSKSSLRAPSTYKEHLDTLLVPSSTTLIPPVPPSPPRTSGHTRQPSSSVPLRTRTNSHLNRSDVAQSPLAQIFQPVVVDDDIPEEDASNGGFLHPHSDGHMLSYGPASRRRITSIQPSITTRHGTDSSSRVPSITQRPPYPIVDTRPETLVEGLFSTSLDRQPEPSSTLGQLEENMEESGGMMELIRRIKGMEERQQRIEDLLLQLSKGFQH
ncbi:hypothetical protein V8B97DRAFT_1865175 [Scleroderma yunnanense]